MSLENQALDIFSEYATDEGLEVRGVWRDLNSTGSRILVGRMGSEAFDEAMQAEVDKASATLALGGALAASAYKDVVLNVMARTVLLGWENVAYMGQVPPYSHEMARKLLSHRDFRKVVERMSSDLERYRLKVEEDQGNG